MKTLVLNGSPHRKGDTAALLSELCKNLDGSIDVFSAYHDQIQPCDDCRQCWKKATCRLDDKMQELYQKINEYDNVIIASPLYFSELSDSLISMCSRFQYFWISRFFKEKELVNKLKNGVLIIVGAGDGTTVNAEKTAEIIFRHLKTTCIGQIFSLNTSKLAAKNDLVALKKAEDLAVRLNQLYLEESLGE
ncbi:multimeric flavodoxin WrbA [Enterococcus sp. PF1-24]|uniref:flavodoxin family protein n=1 Tax=unclassified Enterococcus TaxID=2608891 RepID=UPI002476E1FB|nr:MULTISPECIES: flavodoxin family protein [unclassified Enterococcus]MDH6363193.1 multimeric flavodoxin WrbA [Enterococcus sp. PFB1-1]MDH6400287.1 multimeric flavodoxin WrbA [Enterococcus sp. PF1-24]